MFNVSLLLRNIINEISSKINNVNQYLQETQLRREIARCFVSLNISLSHSRSLKVIRNDTLK